MHSQAAVGLPIFRSEGQARILAAIFLDDAGAWRSLSELGRRAHLAPSTVMREIDRLEAAGLVETERVGNVRRVRADRSSRFLPEIEGLVLKAFGPEKVIGDALRVVPGVRQAYIFGSWARRIRDPAGAPGPPRDLDLVVVGDPRPDEVYAACARAEETLRLAVDPVIVTVDVWEGGTADAAMRGFLDAVKAEQPIALLEDRVP